METVIAEEPKAIFQHRKVLRRYTIYQDNAMATKFKPRNTNTSEDIVEKVSEIKRVQVTRPFCWGREKV